MLKKILRALEEFSLRIVIGSTMCLSAGVIPAFALELNLSTIPLYAASGVPPNILLTFDDSGSMSWAYMPDNIEDVYNANIHKYGCSNSFNGVYYDPNFQYRPAVNSNGTALNATETSFTAAYLTGFETGLGTQNLSTSYRAKWDMSAGGGSYTTVAGCATAAGTTGQPAYYYVYDTTLAGCSSSATDDNCYRMVVVSATSGPGTKDLNGDGVINATDKDERQNFAIWFSYYSTRNLLAQTAVGRAFSTLGGNMRVAGQHLNNTTAGSGTSIKFTTTIGTIQPFTGTERTNFFTRLYNSPANGGTPLRDTMQRAGDYFSSTSNRVYRDNPNSATSPERSCRQNFHIMMTDGFWNGSAGVTTNDDNTTTNFPAAMPAPDSYPYVGTYTPGGTDQLIYRDNTAATLADNAFYYRARDLRPTLPNNVPRHIVQKGPTDSENKVFFNPKNDPAHWQHMVNYTIGLGVDGSLTNNTTTYNNLISGAQTWPAAVADTATAIDDLWHAAVNSRGAYFSARNPTELVNSLTTTLNDLGGRSGSAAAAATSTYYIDNGTTFDIYQSGYNSAGWYGRLRKFPTILSSGTLNISSSTWDAADQFSTSATPTVPLLSASARKIVTYNPSNASGFRGVAFDWSSLNATQQAYLMDDPDTTPAMEAVVAAGQARLDYLRGDTTQEANTTGYNFRARTTTRLGDIASSAPLHVGTTLFKYPDALEAANPTNAEKHSIFGATTRTRTPVIYVGANDGMLHGFNATTGVELLAYVPNAVYRNLNQLTSPLYSHKFYVDGSPVHGDVFFGGTWKTVLVGGLNGGGQGIYALNVSDPSTFSEANASSIVLWEFNDTSDSGDDNGDGFADYELGYTYSEPVITRVRTSSTEVKWVAIFGNGYNNTKDDGAYSRTGYAFLYIVDMSNGNLIKKISTQTGSVGTPNGLSSPSVLDWNGDLIADYVYAGDLLGNMWKFDLTNNSPNNWKVAYGSSTPRPLYKAADDKGTATTSDDRPQPITVAPEIAFHPSGIGNGFIVYFGTGKMLESGDSSAVGADTQAVYGIWDKNTNGSSTPVVQSDLLQQSVINTATKNGIEYRDVTNLPMTWRTSGSSNYLGWYLRLPEAGEKQITNLDPQGWSPDFHHFCAVERPLYIRRRWLADGARLPERRTPPGITV